VETCGEPSQCAYQHQGMALFVSPTLTDQHVKVRGAGYNCIQLFLVTRFYYISGNKSNGSATIFGSHSYHVLARSDHFYQAELGTDQALFAITAHCLFQRFQPRCIHLVG
jgi:hypothetical protein